MAVLRDMADDLSKICTLSFFKGLAQQAYNLYSIIQILSVNNREVELGHVKA